MSAFPEDLLVLEILPRLRLKCLVRFRSVSKSWANLIGTPDYLSKCLINDRILDNPTHQLLFVTRAPNSSDRRLTYSFLNYSTLASTSETHQHLPLQSLYGINIASCNGLLCLFDYYGTGNIVVWNPTTVELILLPHAWHVESVCFGFDPIHEEFKVLRIRYVPEIVEPRLPPYWPGLVHLNQIVEVYSLSGGSWRNLVVNFVVPKLQGAGSSYINGVCFWLALTPVSLYEDQKIVAFDVCDEVIRTMALPNYSLGEITWRTLTVLKELVALIVYPRQDIGEERYFFEIWVMLEFGVEESWVRLVRIVPAICGFGRPLGFWKKGELFVVCRDGELVLYDPFTQTVRTLQLAGEWLQILPFTPSSVGISRFLDG